MNFYHLIILDASGSMQSVRQAAVSSCNETIQTFRNLQKEAAGKAQHFISLVSFNAENPAHYLLERVPAQNVEEISREQYRPNDCTPLYDAIGLACTRLQQGMVDTEENCVTVTVITDGLENSSREYNRLTIHRFIEQLEKKGWTFAYMGANVDVEEESSKLGIKNSMAFLADDEGVHKGMCFFAASSQRRVREVMANPCLAGESSMDFFAEEDEKNAK